MGSYYNIPKAIFSLLKGDYNKPYTLNPKSAGSETNDAKGSEEGPGCSGKCCPDVSELLWLVATATGVIWG